MTPEHALTAERTDHSGHRRRRLLEPPTSLAIIFTGVNVLLESVVSLTVQIRRLDFAYGTQKAGSASDLDLNEPLVPASRYHY